MEHVPAGRRFVLTSLTVGALGGALIIASPVTGVLLTVGVLVVGLARLTYPALVTAVPRPPATPDGGAGGEAAGLGLARGLFLTGVLLSTFNGLRLGAHLTYGDVFFALAATLVAGLLLARTIRLLLPGWLVLSGGLVTVAAVGGAMLAWDGAAQLRSALFFLASMVGITVLALALVTRPRHVAAVLWVLVGSAVVNAGVAVAAQLGFTDLPSRLMTWPISGQQNGLTVHPNHLGLICVLGLAALWGLRRAVGAGAPRRFDAGAVAAAAVLLGGVLVSGSRAAVVALGAAWLWAAVADDARRQRLAIAGVVTVLAVSAALLLRPPSPDRLDQPEGFSMLAERTLLPEVVEGSNERRLDNLVTASRAFEQAPVVGAGFGSARLAHNIYLQVLHAGGVVALLGFLTYVASVVLRGLALVRTRPDLGGLVLGATGATLAWLGNGLVQNALYDRYLYVAPALVVVLFEFVLRGGAWAAAPPLPSPLVVASHQRSR